MSECFKCNWPAIFSTSAGGRAGFGVYSGGKRRKNVCAIFKSIIPGSQLLHKVLLWKDWTRLGSILSLPHCLGQVQLSALPRMASWCDGPHKDEPIKRLTDIFSNPVSFQRTSYYFPTRKNSPRYHPLVGERRNSTQCVYHIHLKSLIC